MNYELIANYIYGYGDMYQEGELPYDEVIADIVKDIKALETNEPKVFAELANLADNNDDISKLSAEGVEVLLKYDNIWYFIEGYVS